MDEFTATEFAEQYASKHNTQIEIIMSRLGVDQRVAVALACMMYPAESQQQKDYVQHIKDLCELNNKPDNSFRKHLGVM